MSVTRKSEQVLSYLKPAERDRLDTFADDRDVSRAEAIRTLVLEGLDRADETSRELTSEGDVVVVV